MSLLADDLEARHRPLTRQLLEVDLDALSDTAFARGGTIEDARVACGGVECVPRRLTVVEDIVKGSAQDEETAELAGGAAARGATPLNFNHFKISLMENLVKRAIRDA